MLSANKLLDAHDKTHASGSVGSPNNPWPSYPPGQTSIQTLVGVYLKPVVQFVWQVLVEFYPNNVDEH